MKKITLFLAGLFLSASIYSQVDIIAKNYLNRVPLNNVQVIVKDGDKTIQTLQTRLEKEFQLELDYGKVYRVYLQHEKCVVMYFEVIANTVPKIRYEFGMSHQFDIPFVNKNDPDVDTIIFQEPFYRIIYDGNKHMIEDTALSNSFDRRLIKKPVKAQEKTEVPPPAINVNDPAVYAGKVYVNENTNVPVKNKLIHAVDRSGYIIKTTSTNRFGAFAFTSVKPADIAGIKLDIHTTETSAKLNKGTPLDLAGAKLSLYNSQNMLLVSSVVNGEYCYWDLSGKDPEKIIDNNYTTNIGGKLVSSSPREKKFFANRNVYLTNSMNTVIKKTKTNKLGSFVFEDIKPDNTYYLEVDKSELGPGEKIDLLNKDDAYIATLDSVKGDKAAMRLNSNYNNVFNNFTIGDDEMKMDIKATIFGDNVNHPIGKLKIVLLNDSYQPIDSTVTDDFGTFKFKYLPFLKRFYLSAENNDNIMDIYKNILIYSSDDNLVKIMTHEKGKKFTYNPVSAELSSLRDVEMEDPWLEFIDNKVQNKGQAKKEGAVPPKQVTEHILFESNKTELSSQAKEILDKIILVLNTNKQLRIEVGAHTDSKGTDEFNMQLSELRAATVKNYISAAGIDAKRIVTKGYGETKLLNNCRDNQPCTEPEHAQNRRIEFKIFGE